VRSRSFACLLSLALGACGAAPPPPPPRAHAWTVAFVALEHRSSMSDAFHLVRIHATLDGAPLAVIDRDPGEGASEPTTSIPTPICLARQEITRGPHTLALELTYAGNGYGVFSYLRSYRFRVPSTQEIDVPEDALGLVVTTTGNEGGSITTPVEDRPHVRWTVVAAHDASEGCWPE